MNYSRKPSKMMPVTVFDSTSMTQEVDVVPEFVPLWSPTWMPVADDRAEPPKNQLLFAPSPVRIAVTQLETRPHRTRYSRRPRRSPDHAHPDARLQAITTTSSMPPDTALLI